MPAVDLSAEGRARAAHQEEQERAAARLRSYASSQERRGLRARIGSNERENCLQQARHARACAGLIASEFGEELDISVLRGGWRRLIKEATRLAAKLRATFEAEAAAKAEQEAQERLRAAVANG